MAVDYNKPKIRYKSVDLLWKLPRILKKNRGYLDTERKVNKYYEIFSDDKVYPVIENLEKSWNSIFFSSPGKFMEMNSRFWKIHKSHGN